MAKKNKPADGNVTDQGIAIKLDDDTTAVIQPELFAGYYLEASGYLGTEAKAKGEFKQVVETVAETTKLSKRVVSKYFKAKFKASTGVDQEIGRVFAELDALPAK